LMPLMLKEEAGDVSGKEIERMEHLQERIEYEEHFISKFGGFKTEMDSKLEYAKSEFENLQERANKLLKQFACDPNQYLPKDLFELLFRFAQDFSEAFKRMLQKIKLQEEKLQ